MRSHRLSSLVLAAGFGLALPIAAQLTPLSAVFPVWAPGTESGFYQGGYANLPGFPAAAALQHGFAITALSSTPHNDWAVNGRVVDLSGQAGPSFLGEFLGDGAEPVLQPPAIGARGVDGFAVAWVEGPHNLLYRLFGPGGAPSGPAVYLVEDAPGLCATAVAGNAAGAFAIAAEYCSYPGYPTSLFVRGFDASGSVATGELAPAIVGSRARQGRPRVGIDAQGRIVVVWRQEGETAGDPPRICARAYGVRGGSLGSPFCAGELAGKTAGALAVDPEGRFLVAWFGPPTGTAVPLLVRRYQMDGVPLGAAVQVATAVDPADLTASADGHGNAALSWREGDRLRVLLVSRDAAVRGTAIAISGVASHPGVEANGVALSDSGRLLVTWRAAGGDGSGGLGGSVLGQLWQASF